LDLSWNLVRALPPELSRLPSSVDVRIIGNPAFNIYWESSSLENIHPCVCQLDIVFFNAAVNRLSELPLCFGFMPLLKEVHLNTNLLSALPASFGHLALLQYLDLESNKFSQIPAALLTLPSLSTLWLANNQLKDLPFNFDRMPSLSQLTIDRNLFDRWPAVLIRMMQRRRLTVAFGKEDPDDEIRTITNTTCGRDPKGTGQGLLCGLRCDAFPTPGKLLPEHDGVTRHIKLNSAPGEFCPHGFSPLSDFQMVASKYEPCARGGQQCGYLIQAPAGRRLRATLNPFPHRQWVYDGEDDNAPLVSDPSFERSFLGPPLSESARTIVSSGRFLYFMYFQPIGNGGMFSDIDFQYVVI